MMEVFMPRRSAMRRALIDGSFHPVLAMSERSAPFGRDISATSLSWSGFVLRSLRGWPLALLALLVAVFLLVGFFDIFLSCLRLTLELRSVLILRQGCVRGNRKAPKILRFSLGFTEGYQ